MQIQETNILNLKEYFENFTPDKKLFINSSFPISLHWINNSFLCSKIKKLIKISDHKISKEISILEIKLEKLKKVKFWLKVEKTIIPMTAFDMYNSMSINLKNGSFENELFNCQHISFVSPAGPFKDFTLVECINDQTLESFLYLKVLRNQLAQRNFRLNVHGTAKVYFGEFHEESTNLNLEQITESGILFSSECDFFQEHLDHQYLLKFQMTSEHIKKYFDGPQKEPIKDPFKSDNNFDFYMIEQNKVVKSLKYDSVNSGKLYLFCRFSHMQKSEIPNDLKAFVEEYKNILKSAA